MSEMGMASASTDARIEYLIDLFPTEIPCHFNIDECQKISLRYLQKIRGFAPQDALLYLQTSDKFYLAFSLFDQNFSKMILKKDML